MMWLLCVLSAPSETSWQPLTVGCTVQLNPAFLCHFWHSNFKQERFYLQDKLMRAALCQAEEAVSVMAFIHSSLVLCNCSQFKPSSLCAGTSPEFGWWNLDFLLGTALFIDLQDAAGGAVPAGSSCSPGTELTAWTKVKADWWNI